MWIEIIYVKFLLCGFRVFLCSLKPFTTIARPFLLKSLCYLFNSLLIQRLITLLKFSTSLFFFYQIFIFLAVFALCFLLFCKISTISSVPVINIRQSSCQILSFFEFYFDKDIDILCFLLINS